MGVIRLSATTRYADSLGSDFTCLAENPDDESQCPMFVGGGPESDPYSGVISCPKCGTELGSEQPTGEELYDDDPDDEEYAGSKGDYVAEGPVRIDETPKENRQRRLLVRLDEMLPILRNHDTKLAIDIDNKKYEIIEMLYKLEAAKVPAFMIRGLKAKLLPIALYLTKTELPAAVYVELNQRPAKVAQMVEILIQLDSPHEDNQLETQFTTLGRMVGIPDSITNNAYETYIEEKPYPAIDEIRVTISSWLYHYCKRVNFNITMKVFYEKVSGVSRNSLSKAVNSLDEQLRNAQIQTEVIEE